MKLFAPRVLALFLGLLVFVSLTLARPDSGYHLLNTYNFGLAPGSTGEYFDYVTLDQVAEHVTDPLALMRGVARVLKPGGKVVITTPNARSLGARIFRRKWLRNWNPERIKKIRHRRISCCIGAGHLKAAFSKHSGK